MRTVTPVPSRRRYGPATRSSRRSVEPTVRVSLTASGVVLTASDRPAPNVTPGTARARVPETRPATPVEPSTNMPEPLVSVAGPKVSVALSKPRTVCPDEGWATAMSAVIDWPRTPVVAPGTEHQRTLPMVADLTHTQP